MAERQFDLARAKEVIAFYMAGLAQEVPCSIVDAVRETRTPEDIVDPARKLVEAYRALAVMEGVLLGLEYADGRVNRVSVWVQLAGSGSRSIDTVVREFIGRLPV